jgi:hypothetical protein
LDVKEFLVKGEYDPRELIGLIEKYVPNDVALAGAAASASPAAAL